MDVLPSFNSPQYSSRLGAHQLPRLTRYLRKFTNLEPRKELIDNSSTNTLVRPLERHKKFSWADLKKIIESQSCMSSAVTRNLSQLQELSRSITGGEQTIIDETSLFVFRLFMDKKKPLNKHCTVIKQLYGNVSFNTVNQICGVVNQIVEELPEDCLTAIKRGYEAKSELGETGGPGAERWGGHILYNPPSQWTPLDTSCLSDLSLQRNSVDSFSMVYNQPESCQPESQEKTVYDRGWLTKELEKCFPAGNPMGVSTAEFSDSVIQMLSSSKSTDELQNELFDFLGYDNFELTSSLLEHRKDISMSVKLENERKLMLKPLVKEGKRDGYMSQVTIKSRDEKQQEKQARKEDKRLAKYVQQREAEPGQQTEDDLERDKFDPVELRAKRLAALASAPSPWQQQTGEKKRTAEPKEHFPHVYDSVKTAQSQIGFIAGSKILLPENVKRTDTKQFEEVDIPISPPASLPVGNERIPVASLDEIGQVAFSGLTHLNRIQSVVFPTAYNTNENLLICAPTGAGKTNIALLTVIYTIRQNIVNGVIKKDQFKIVYVAPMKALAAEMTASFSKRLSPLGLSVKELTGDIQLTKAEILQTQMIVTTPEKWDVVTRKGTGDVALTRLVKLLIIDEVHLLHGDRGPVVEALVARTLRQVESSQTMIRIVGLSATLPNYIDVARFLRVNPSVGLFYFDSRFRPVPLRQTFIGVKATKPLLQMNEMDTVCYEKVSDLVKKGHQVMVFVHARNATSRTAGVLIEMARQKNELSAFSPESAPATTNAAAALARARSKQLAEFFQAGFSVHHAGLLRADRSLVEKYFGQGLIKVLVCTATLAWGVNLPAHAVVIRGTEIYDAKHGSFVDLGILDVLQIFGRAGRPQFDTSGHGLIITSHAKLSHYLSLLTNQFPIESNFINFLADNLNAEISLGTISNVNEAVEWLSYTYLFVRMRINPQVYGINYQDVLDDPRLEDKRRELIDCAAKALDKARMIRYNMRTGDLAITDLGRIASNFYIKYDTVEVFNEMMSNVMSESEILAMVSHSQEFQQLKVRDDEMEELSALVENCEYEVAGGKENIHGKVNILIQSYLGRQKVNSFSLMSDLSYINQNAVRIMRALFEINLRGNNALLAGKLHQMALMLERQQWAWETPLRQFSCLPQDVIEKVERRDLSVQAIREMDSKEIGLFVRNARLGPVLKRCAHEFPLVELEASLHPITRTILRIKLRITPDFKWNDKVHSKSSEAYWVWIEDPVDTNIYHSEYFLLSRKQVQHRESQELVMTMPLVEPMPSQYMIKVSSDYWLGCTSVLPISVHSLILPESHPPHTELLDLQPLPVKALDNPDYESLYKFTHFNPIQTQLFHCLYHTDNNVLLGAPTGSGKTIVAEIATFRVFNKYPGSKIVYVAPLKALVRERIEDWKVRLEGKLGRSVVELTGDVTPDVQAMMKADVIVTTPEKWDGISRSWQTRGYVSQVALIVLDEVHLLGEERGPVLEVIVSRTNFISAHTSRPLRIVALSTALANATDLANWLGIKEMGLYNFRPSVRPVPLEVHIAGFPGKHYCPRMATMNRPVFQAISTHSPDRPALVFVSSRRQTRLTALDLIAYLAAEDNPKMWMHTSEQEMDQIIATLKDSNLRLTLAFGIGLHHAGLQDRDRKTVEELFINQKIQVVIATGTLAWGVNLPAHLVVVKGTEYYEGKTKRYVDMPITDVLQMMGRAGRPQYDNQGVAVILVHDVKKNFYRRFLYEPFPVESSLLGVLADHLSAEIVAGTVTTRQDALHYLTWTYFFRRLLKNPAYYGLESLDQGDVNRYLSQLVDKTLLTLYYAGCVELDADDDRGVHATSLGRIAAYYYLAHQTMSQLCASLGPALSLQECCYCLAHCFEFSLLPVRHNEENLNGELAEKCRWEVGGGQLDSPHIKTYLLLQAHFSRLELPSTDYYTDLKSVLDQAIRILQGMIDTAAERGWLVTTLRLQQLLQMVLQGRWLSDSPLLCLPHIESFHVGSLGRKRAGSLPAAVHAASQGYPAVAQIFSPELDEGQIQQVYRVLKTMPVLKVRCQVEGGLSPAVGSKELLLTAGEEYLLTVSLERLNKHSSDRRAHTPRYHKMKSEGWILSLGSIETGELLAMKRVSFQRNRTTAQLVFCAPLKAGPVILSLYVLSDAYLGLDQQYEIPATVTDPRVLEPGELTSSESGVWEQGDYASIEKL